MHERNGTDGRTHPIRQLTGLHGLFNLFRPFSLSASVICVSEFFEGSLSRIELSSLGAQTPVSSVVHRGHVVDGDVSCALCRENCFFAWFSLFWSTADILQEVQQQIRLSQSRMNEAV